MTAMQLADFRALTSERLAAWNADYYANRQQGDPGYSAPPPELIEGMVALESGFDPGLIDPGGAVGLGQITEGGLEWGLWKANHPNAKFSDMTNPAKNLDVMIDGLSYRQFQGKYGPNAPGAWQDWYLAAGGYLGGLGNDGSEHGADSYGTTWRDYVRRVHNYIADTWGAQTAQDIDLLEEGAAVAAEDDWINGEIRYDPNAPATEDHDGLFDKLEDIFNKGIDVGKGVVADVAADVLNGIAAFVGQIAPRLGLALAGLALAVVGVIVLARPAIQSSLLGKST